MEQIVCIAAKVFLIMLMLLCAFSEREEFVANFSGRQLRNVPQDLPSRTIALHLSQNNISALLFSDVSYMPGLKFINISYNFIEELDLGIFALNKDLQYLDISHNSLRSFTCSSIHAVQHLKYLDFSYNKFRTMSLCKELHFLSRLKYLRLSATEIHKSDFDAISSLELETLYLGLEDLSSYERGSLQAVTTKKLHIAVPKGVASLLPLLDAFTTSQTLELSNIRCDTPCEYPTTSISQINKLSRIKTLIFSNLTMSFANVGTILQSIFNSSVEYLYIYSLTLVHKYLYFKFDFSNSVLKKLAMKHISKKVFLYHGIYPNRMYSEMVVEDFTLSDSDIVHLPCPPETNIFHVLDVSENRITDVIFQNCSSLVHLETLNLRRNKLEELAKVSSMTSSMISLSVLDISENLLYYENGRKCYWPVTLVALNMSSSGLTDSVFECLPIKIKLLNLQNNQITSIPKAVRLFTYLEELNIAFNRLTDLPDCSRFSSLVILNVEMNSIFSPSFESSHNCMNVKTIYAGNNPFVCHCDLRDFINQGNIAPDRLSGWLNSYKCQYPDGVRGTLLKDFHLSELSCNTTLLIVTILTSTVVLILCLCFLCRFFNVPWYIRMLWQWMRTKYRTKKMTTQDLERDLLFHAFVSYSEHDSDWVKNCLLPNLQKEDGSIRICQHERHFIPGKGIIENIINCIEKSYKSIFVLSPNFVQSEWCHYELYFAHHRLFHENSDSLILILLEPIPQHLIPARYHKLKALMACRSYLEWPMEKSKHGLFWTNLKEAIKVKIPTSEQAVENPLHCNQIDELELDS
ncbi:toll-like receptor 6 [Pleurodeles waltl]|uniref:toll-like receptor 6 n=1 Tax=Pleurodeles waltl TaxID=8319 RepID=UPI003709399C